MPDGLSKLMLEVVGVDKGNRIGWSFRQVVIDIPEVVLSHFSRD